MKEKNFAFQGLEKKKKKLKSERWREFKIRGHQHSLATSSSTTNKPPVITRWITENCKKKKNSRRDWFVAKRTTLTKQNKTKKTPQWRLAPSRVSNKFYPLILQTKKKKNEKKLTWYENGVNRNDKNPRKFLLTWYHWRYKWVYEWEMTSKSLAESSGAEFKGLDRVGSWLELTMDLRSRDV